MKAMSFVGGLACLALAFLVTDARGAEGDSTAAEPAPPAAGEQAAESNGETDDEPAAWRIGLGIAADVPVHIGGRLAVEAPNRIRFGTSVGILPGPYLDVINGVATQFEGYTDDTAELVADTLSSSLVWRLFAGYRPFAESGFFVELNHPAWD